MAHITQCILQQAPSNQNKREQERERSKSIKIKLTKATNKLFQRKSIAAHAPNNNALAPNHVKSSSDIITNEFAVRSVGGGSISDDLDLSSKTTSGRNS